MPKWLTPEVAAALDRDRSEGLTAKESAEKNGLKQHHVFYYFSSQNGNGSKKRKKTDGGGVKPAAKSGRGNIQAALELLQKERYDMELRFEEIEKMIDRLKAL